MNIRVYGQRNRGEVSLGLAYMWRKEVCGFGVALLLWSVTIEFQR